MVRFSSRKTSPLVVLSSTTTGSAPHNDVSLFLQYLSSSALPRNSVYLNSLWIRFCNNGKDESLFHHITRYFGTSVGKLVLDKYSWWMDNPRVHMHMKKSQENWNIEMYYILTFHCRNVIIRNPRVFFSVFANIFLLFIYRVKYFRGKKLNGEYEIRVEQVCAIQSSSSLWLNYCSYIASHFSFYWLNFCQDLDKNILTCSLKN